MQRALVIRRQDAFGTNRYWWPTGPTAAGSWGPLRGALTFTSVPLARLWVAMLSLQTDDRIKAVAVKPPETP